MKDKYGEPMTFDKSLIPAHVAPMAARAEVGSWGMVLQCMVLLEATGGSQ